MEIRIDDLQGSAIKALLQEHLDVMHEHSSPGSVRTGQSHSAHRPGNRAARPFVAAQKLYASEGFVEGEPFADYALDPYSLFTTKFVTADEFRLS